MFLKIAKNLNFKTPRFSSSFHTSLPSQYATSKATIDLNLLFPFDRSKTLQALSLVDQATKTQKNVFNPSNIKILDQTGSTSYSQTFRAYDKESNIIFAQKKLLLDSAPSWNQLNLILRQYAIRSPDWADNYSISFDERNQEVKVISQINKNTVGDYSQFLASHDMRWTDALLESCTQQILSQLRAIRLMNAKCETVIKPQNMFIDDKLYNLKIFDFSDFTIEHGNLTKTNEDIALQTLVQVLNPDVQVSNVEEAKIYLSRCHPSFFKGVPEIFSGETQFEVKSHHLDISSDYEIFITKKLELFDEKVSSTTKGIDSFIEFQEELKHLKQLQETIETGYLKQIEAINLFKNQKPIAEAYEQLFKMKDNIVKAQQGLAEIDPLAQEKSLLSYRFTSTLLIFTAHCIQLVLGFFLIFIFYYIFFLIFAGIIMAGDYVIKGIKSFSSSPVVDEKNQSNLDQNDDKTNNN